jgi:membrane fusion protein, multidrug efflux system
MHNLIKSAKTLGLTLLIGCVGQSILYAQSRIPLASAHQRELDGVIQPACDSEVASIEMGVVRQVFVKPGDHVVRGQPLIELESEGIQGQIRVKKAEAESTGKIEQAQAELTLQQAKFEKLSKLLFEGKASASEVDRAKVDLSIASGRLQTEQETIQVLKSDLARFTRQLEDRTVRAPFDGIVTDVFKEIGEVVATNSPSVLRMIDVKKLRATFSVQESELPSLNIGKLIKLQLANGSVVEGTIEYVPPVADPETGWFMINVSIDNHDGKIIGSRCSRIQ